MIYLLILIVIWMVSGLTTFFIWIWRDWASFKNLQIEESIMLFLFCVWLGPIGLYYELKGVKF